jgi:predicted MFS family arabinose efflux permease
MLALVMLINRSGTMVLPFLSIYLTGALGYTVGQAGIILSMFGLGSMCGAYLGGWLTDRVGHFKVQFLSLILGGLLFFVLSGISQFMSLAIGVFVLSLVADSMRPANAVSVAFYARPENVSRAFSLNRMAINLGFSIGPALGGLLAAVSYRMLFVADGITCIGAGILFFLYFRKRQGFDLPSEKKTEPVARPKSPYRDFYFVIFIILCTGYAMLFFQLFATLPLYYREVYQLSEAHIGGLMALNGLIVFALEMIIVYIVGQRVGIGRLIVGGCVLISLSFALLNVASGVGVLVAAMVLMSLSEIFAMPFMATVTVQRSQIANRGAYMGMYALSFSGAHVLAPLLGTRLIMAYGYDTLWWVAAGVSVLVGLGFHIVMKKFR